MSNSENDPQDVAPAADGGSPESAVPVGSIREEYSWVARNLPGARFVRQALAFRGDKPLDVFTLVVDQEERHVFFDISAFFGRGKKAPASIPCPYCGGALRTRNAKQCFQCGMDWRDPDKIIRRDRTSIEGE
jgi:hypothetical protein